MNPVVRSVALVTFLAVSSGEAGAAQLMPSERASVSQTVDGTVLTVEYSRPRARGRTAIYGTMERWNRAWTPGANDATTLAFNKPVTILGKNVPAGTYSVWLVLREQGPWTLVLDPRAKLFHTAHPDSTAQQFRMAVTPMTVPHTEALTWSFPSVSNRGVTLDMRWGTMGVSIPIGITPTYPLSMSPDDAAPFLGEFQFVSSEGGSPLRYVLLMRDGALIAQRPGASGGAPVELQLLPVGENLFAQGFMFRGEVWATDSTSRVRFLRTGTRVTGFEMLDVGKVSGRATRTTR